MGRRSGRKRSFRPGRFIVRAVAALLLFGLIGSAALVGLLRVANPPFTAMMLEQPMPLADQRHDWRDREHIAASAAYAVIAAEDQRFLMHNGFDFASIEKALEDYRAGEGLRGASTITQQVAKNLFLWPGRSFFRKGIEAYFTLLIEAFWPKERILEVYLNVAEFGTGVFGVEAASQEFFATSAAELRPEQAALLAAVLPNPKELRADRPSEYVRSRQAHILGQMRTLRAHGHYGALAW
ncbi:MAG TPA: monofunctional biosynthetic peptidoglycan transglycosylase [Gammaproteobacteria bacterium]